MNARDFRNVYKAMVEQAVVKTSGIPTQIELDIYERRCFAFWLADNYNAEMTRKDTAEYILYGYFPKLTCSEDLDDQLYKAFANLEDDEFEEWFQNMTQHINDFFGVK
jgi:hypothetical protein